MKPFSQWVFSLLGELERTPIGWSDLRGNHRTRPARALNHRRMMLRTAKGRIAPAIACTKQSVKGSR